ncbi:MAG: HPr family phosphocarrier protein [Firmicutes bacterium]|nr:HPr family phosphocarrier protein [Bacillota bacterium]
MIDHKFKIAYPFGLHARPATMLVSKANSFQAEMMIEFDDKKTNLKSIMGVLSLGVPQNRVFSISFNGKDEEEAFKAISRVLAEINELI